MSCDLRVLSGPCCATHYGNNHSPYHSFWSNIEKIFSLVENMTSQLNGTFDKNDSELVDGLIAKQIPNRVSISFLLENVYCQVRNSRLIAELQVFSDHKENFSILSLN